MLGEWLPIAILLGVAAAFSGGSLLVGHVVGPQRPNPSKLAAYECGNEPLAEVSGAQFAVKFYLVALSFLIFDVEVVFVFPWAVVFRQLGWFGIGAMGVFLAVLFIGLIYEYRAGGLEWD
ncbi:MAG: NADH-quinone oxidoreductase subunit A [Actinomycetota bacterium]|nr:NADH-quinone oxidoreductase subunit A [Actinomycetota bacterium]